MIILEIRNSKFETRKNIKSQVLNFKFQTQTMQINPLNHNSENNNGFSLFNGLFVFKVPETPDAEMASRTKEKELEKAEKLREKLKKEIEKDIKDYNKSASKDFDSWDEEKKSKEAFKEPLPENLDKYNLHEIIAKIDGILGAPYFDDSEWHSLIGSVDHKDRVESLLAIRQKLTDSKDIQTKDNGIFKIDLDFLQAFWNRHFSDRQSPRMAIRKNLIPEDILSKKPHGEDYREHIRIYKALLREMNYKLLRLESGEEGLEYTLTWARSKVALQIALLELKGIKNPFNGLNDKYNEAFYASADTAGEAIVNRLDRLRIMAEKKAGWESKKAYGKIENAFDRATTTPIISAGRDEFKDFWEYSETGYSSSKFEESKQLFMTIMSIETHNFDTDLVLGGKETYVDVDGKIKERDKFGNDHDKNRKNFPFIYNEWIKHQGINETAIKTKEGEIDSLDAQLTAKLGEFKSVEELIKVNDAAGINTKKLEAIDSKIRNLDSSEYWKAREGELSKLQYKLKGAIGRDPKSAEVEGYKNALKILKFAEKIARTKWAYFRSLFETKKETDATFTKKNLSHPTNRQILVELVMRKMKKAMEIVDKSSVPHGDWSSQYHEMIRRMLIVTVYNQGVSALRVNPQTGEEEFVKSTGPEHYWLLSRLTSSDYFSNEFVDDHLHPSQRNVLLIGTMANKVFVELEYAKTTTREIMKDAIKVKKGEMTEVKLRAKKYPKHLVDIALSSGGDDTQEGIRVLKVDLTDINESIEKKEKFIAEAEKLIKKPFKNPETKELTDQAKTFIDAIFAGIKYSDVINKDEMEHFSKMITNAELNYKTLNVRQESRMDYLGQLGIDTRGVYQLYLQEIDKDKTLNVFDWDDLKDSKNKADFDKLHKFLGRILKTSDPHQRERFMKVFGTLRDHKFISKDPEANKNQWAVLQIYNILKEEIIAQEKAAASAGKKQKEIASKLKGMHIGGKLTKYIKKIFHMITGPGQSWANRGAGLIIAIAALKLGKKAIKGKDTTSTLLRLAFMAGAIEIITKETTGRGVFDRLGLDSIQGSIEGTFEAVLMDHGDRYMEENEIEPEEHAAALYEMNKIPFNKLMDWYDATDSDGWPREGKTDSFPNGIRVGKIVKGVRWKERDKKREVRRIIKRTMDNFFDYVAKKERTDPGKAKKMIRERWVKMLKNKDYKPRHSDFMYQELLNTYRKNPNRLTWQIVMRAECDLYDVEQTKNKHGLSPALEMLGQASDSLMRFTRQDILYGKLGGNIEEWFKSVPAHAKDIKEFLAEVAGDSELWLYGKKESLGFWYEGNKYEIRRFMGQHVELITTGIKLPFQVLYAADQMIVPFALSKLKQLKDILRSDVYRSIDHDLEVGDILRPGVDLDSYEKFDLENNPEFSYFGLYQKAFHQAFTGRPEPGHPNIRFFETPSLIIDKRGIAENYPDSKVGYCIVETNEENADLNQYDKNHGDRLNKMQAESYEQAKRFFLSQDVPIEAIETYMYPIHAYSKQGTNPPEKIYTFWRMPMPGSDEYNLKMTGRWADNVNPNKLKDRIPFFKDPSMTLLENLEQAIIYNMSTGRSVTGTLGTVAIQPFHFALGSLEKIGNIAEKILNWRPLRRNRTGRIDWIRALTRPIPEAQQQTIDEMCTSGESSMPWPVSTFYKDKDNSTAYKIMLAYAVRNSQVLYLDIMNERTVGTGRDRVNYESDFYQKKPRGFKYSDVKDFYDNEWVPQNKKNAAFERSLTARARLNP
jgi:hypothetical protein